MNLFDSVDKLGPLDVPSATSLTDAAGDSSRFNTALCFPFESLLLALNTTRVDYFSLDVEGFELDVLKVIPFDRLDVDVISCRFLHSRESTKAYDELLSQHGYDRYPDFSKTDFIFAKTHLLRRQNLAPAAATAAATGGRQDEFKPSRVEQRHIEDDVAQGKLDSQMDLQRQLSLLARKKISITLPQIELMIKIRTSIAMMKCVRWLITSS
jgi:hypothetical protein